MGQNAGPVAIRLPQPLPGHRAVHARVLRHLRQEVTAAHIRKETNRRLRHGKHRLLTAHTIRTMNRDADTATHHNTIKQRNQRLSVAFHVSVEAILIRKERQAHINFLRPVFGNLTNISARAKGLFTVALNENMMNRIINQPALQLPVHRNTHLMCQRIQRLGAIENDKTSMALLFKKNISSFGQDFPRIFLLHSVPIHFAKFAQRISEKCLPVFG